MKVSTNTQLEHTLRRDTRVLIVHSKKIEFKNAINQVQKVIMNEKREIHKYN